MCNEPDVSFFGGDIAETYEQYLGPVLFEPFARDIAVRMPTEPGMRILEIAAGTGRLTRHLLAKLPADGRLLATDISAGMLEVARRELADARLEWQAANAQSLPFDDAGFDAVVCQFGAMFFPDKRSAYAEARRVLRPGGEFLFSVWGPHARNPWAEVAHRTMQECFPGDPDPLLVKPFAFSDEARTHAVLSEAGFARVETSWSDFPLIAESGARFARGFVTGTPLLDGIRERDGDVETCVQALTEAYRSEFGDCPMRTRMSALVVRAGRAA